MRTSVRRGIYGKLAGDTTLNALLATPPTGYSKSLFHNQAPEGAAYPFVIFSKSAGTPIQSETLPAALTAEVWLVKAVDHNTSADTAESIADRVDALLNDAKPSVSGATVSYLRRQSDVEYSEVVDGEDYRHVGALYRLVYS